jgi:hypothetical protein
VNSPLDVKANDEYAFDVALHLPRLSWTFHVFGPCSLPRILASLIHSYL